jgi:hypothetical protein
MQEPYYRKGKMSRAIIPFFTFRAFAVIFFHSKRP